MRSSLLSGRGENVKNRALRLLAGLLLSLALLGSGLVCACGPAGKGSEAAAAHCYGEQSRWTLMDNDAPDAPEGELETVETAAPAPEPWAAFPEARVLAAILGALLVIALCVLLALRVRVLKPLHQLTEMTKQLDKLDAEELALQAEGISGEPGESARAIAAYAAAEESMAVDASSSVGTEESYKMRVVDEICRSLLPQDLKENAAGMTFAIAGDIQQGARRNCAFYDYFFLDENTLCLVTGQVPGSGIAEAMFAVVAQTAIRSRLRLGRSLIETMSDVNSQLYDIGGKNYVNAMVGVLNTVSGQFSFVNAGGSQPFLMRSEGRYEWLRTPVYAALGANESVSYRSEVLRFNQGDRLFLYTADLGEMENQEREKFREQELQSALNRSRSKTRSPEELLSYMQDEAAVFCESGNDLLSSAVLALEYKKGNRDYVFTVVQGTPEYAANVTEFIRKTLEERGIAPKDRARQILMADELFALCCRACPAASDIKVACALMPEENTVHLRMFAPMGGRDPLEVRDNPAGENAASYIRTHTKRAAFEAGTDRDMVEIISELPG